MTPIKVSDSIKLERLIRDLKHTASDFSFYPTQDMTTQGVFSFCADVIRNNIKNF